MKSKCERSEPCEASKGGGTSRFGSRDPRPDTGSSADHMVQEKQDEVRYGSLVEPQSQQGAGAIVVAKS